MPWDLALTPGRSYMELSKISRGHMPAGNKGPSLYSQQITCWAYTADSHCSWILHLQMCLLSKVCDPKINIHNAFTIIHRPVQSNKKFELRLVFINSWGHTRRCFASFSFCTLPYYKQWSFHGWFTITFFTFFWYRTKASFSGPKHSKAVMSLTEKIHVSDSFIQAWVIMLLAMSSILINQ